MLKNLRYILFKKWPCGYTIKQVKKILETNTHCGKYWNTKAKSNRFKGIVSIVMEENEALYYDMVTGKGLRKDFDGDGCSITDNFDFSIGYGKDETKLTILKRR